MRLPREVGHPFGLGLLCTSALLALAMAALPSLAPWSERAPWMLLLGVLAYAATLAVARRSRPSPSGPELRTLQLIRRSMAARLADRQTAESGGPTTELTKILAEAVAQLDQQVVPALSRLLERQTALAAELGRYDRGELPPPEPAVLERLRAIHFRQKAAIHDCVQQAVNADATLVALLQEADDDSVAERARVWARDLLVLYDSLADVLRGASDLDLVVATLEPETPASLPPMEESEPQPTPASNGAVDLPAERLVRLTEEALRRLNNPAGLAQCELVASLPRTVAATCARRGGDKLVAATPLEQAQALREVLASAIELLKPAGATSSGAPQALQYHILREEYLLGTSNKYIMTRYSISESTFHRHRREAIAALARELRQQEELLARQRTAARPGSTPTTPG